MNQLANQAMGQQTDPIVQALQQIQNSANPRDALVQVLSRCKNGDAAIEALKNNNWNEEQAFYELARRQCIDSNQFLKSLASMNLK